MDIYAGGFNILTSGPNKAVCQQPSSHNEIDVRRSQNVLAQGTSVAAPQVAGLIAAIIGPSHSPILSVLICTDVYAPLAQDGNATPAAMKAKIIQLGVTNKIQGLSASSHNIIAQLPDSLKGDDDDFGDFQGRST